MIKEDIIKIIELYKSGLGSDSIAKIYNIHPNSILKILKKNNIERRSLSRFTQNDFDEMKKLYESGLSSSEIGEKYNVTHTAILKILKKNNVHRRASETTHRKYAINESFFDLISTEEQAYFLGFLYADGSNNMLYNYSTSIGLSEIDKEILIKFAKLIYINENDAINAVKTYDRSHHDKGTECVLYINSKHICVKLYNLGCVPQKTFILKYPNFLNKDLHRHFIRGYFDGDGSIYGENEKFTGVKIVSTKEFLYGVQNEIKDICSSTIYKNSKENDKNTYILTVNGNRNIQKFLNWIYGNGSIYLERKYKKYLLFCDKMKDIDSKCLFGSQGYSKSNVIKNYPDFFEPLNINGLSLNKNTIMKFSKDEKDKISYDILNYIRSIGFNLFTNNDFKNDIKLLFNSEVDILKDSVTSNSRLCTMLCKLYCGDLFYKSKYNGKMSVYEAFNNDDLLFKVIKNRLGLNWNCKEHFDISYNSILNAFNVSGICYNVSVFKPSVAKYLYLKFSNENDIVYDYSAGWGGRMLGAASCNRKYIGIDPLTIDNLNLLQTNLNLSNIELINGMSEEFCLDENTIDFSFSSPPYYNLEIYSDSNTQAYNKGEDYFYNVYWKNTLLNIKKMLKKDKWFGVNTNNKRMVDLAIDVFGNFEQEIKLTMSKMHLNKSKTDKIKYEPIYMFKNNK